ncbi:DUF4143 domain-containing protein [Metamycoplasma equirhinis]|uniref:DUF4143 domain-containing protein n=1 Tax=Metamycoplasma equirhinis TaxID=92402 RepID=UPI0035936201
MLVSKERSLFKLFLSDIGLLTYKLLTANKKILNCKSFLNYGAIYEAVMAQELIAHGFQSYYNNDKKRGEIDFLIELNNKVISIEIIFERTIKDTLF